MFEPEASLIVSDTAIGHADKTQLTAFVSIAISLRRIADQLEQGDRLIEAISNIAERTNRG